MSGLRIAVLAFCTLVVVLCVWALSSVVKSLNLMKPQLSEQADLLAEVRGEEKTLSGAWLALDSKQRVERADYDGPEAVDASYETQLARAAFDQTKAVRQELETRFTGLKSQQRAMASWITPLIVIGLIHIIIFSGLWPKLRKPANR